MSILRHSLRRIGPRQIFTLALILTGIPWIAVLLAAMITINSYLVPEINTRTETVAHLVETDIDHALSLGIPLQKLVGVAPYLEGVMKHNPDLSFIAITDAAHHVLYGINVQGTRRLLHNIGDDVAITQLIARYGSDTTVVSVTLGGRTGSVTMQDASAPAQKPQAGSGAITGTLFVAAPSAPATSVYLGLQSMLLVGFVAVLFGCYELLTFMAARSVAAPIAAADRLIDRIAAGDLRHTERVLVDALVGHLLTTLNRIVRVLSDRVAEFRIYTQEVRRATRSAGKAAGGEALRDLDALGALVERGISIGSTGPRALLDIDTSPLDRLIMFMLSFACAALGPLLYFLLQPGRGTGFDTEHFSALAGFFSGLLLLGRLVRPAMALTGRSVAMVVAVAMIALALFEITGGTRGLGSEVMGYTLLGTFLGFLVMLHLDGDAEEEDRTVLANPRAALLTGVTAGFSVATVQAGFGTDRDLVPLALGTIVLATALSWLAHRRQHVSQRARWLSLGEIGACLGRWRIMLAALGLTAPLRALAILTLAVDMPRHLDALDSGTPTLALALLGCALAAIVASSIASALLARSALFNRPLAVMSRVILAAGMAVVGVDGTGAVTFVNPLAVAALGYGLTALGQGLALPSDRRLAAEGRVHDPDIGAWRATLFSELVSGIVVVASLVAATYLPPAGQHWLRSGLVMLCLAACALYAGVATRSAKIAETP